MYGIKPTFGRVPAYPLSPFGTVAHIGPMTRTVADSALMLTVMNEPDARDWYAVPGDGADLRRACTASVKGWRIAYSPLLGNRSVHPEVAALVTAAAEALVDLGAIVEEDRKSTRLNSSH